jgi:hypothetical protein
MQSSAEEENDDSIDTFIDIISSSVKGNILEDYFVGQLVNSIDTHICFVQQNIMQPRSQCH